MILRPEDLVTKRLEGVTAAWHEFGGARSADPVHLWLRLGDLGTVRVHTAGDGTLELRLDSPYDSYDMDRHGQVVVEEAGVDSTFADLLGSEIEEVRLLREMGSAQPVGIVLSFSGGSVGLANLGDEIIVRPWPDQTWTASQVRIGRD